MNYLAHLLLSGTDNDLLFGNFIADHVKGSAMSSYMPPVKRGIVIHRAIDTYTDSHPVTEQGKLRLRTVVRKYAPVALDVIYDHFLAVHWQEYHEQPLDEFLEITYGLLDSRTGEMPERARQMYSFMRRDNWLGGYLYREGVMKALNGLSRRTKFESNLNKAIYVLDADYPLFEQEFLTFFPQLQNHVLSAIAELKM